MHMVITLLLQVHAAAISLSCWTQAVGQIKLFSLKLPMSEYFNTVTRKNNTWQFKVNMKSPIEGLVLCGFSPGKTVALETR